MSSSKGLFRHETISRRAWLKTAVCGGAAFFGARLSSGCDVTSEKARIAITLDLEITLMTTST